MYLSIYIQYIPKEVCCVITKRACYFQIFFVCGKNVKKQFIAYGRQ